MTLRERMTRWFGAAVAVSLAVVAVYFVVVTAPQRESEPQEPARDSAEDTAQAIQRLLGRFPDRADATCAVPSLRRLVEDVDALLADLGFDTPDRPWPEELERSGLDPSAPAAIHFVLDATRHATPGYIAEARLRDREAFERWVSEDEGAGPPAPPETTAYRAITVHTGLPDATVWAELDGYVAFGTGLELLHSLIDAHIAGTSGTTFPIPPQHDAWHIALRPAPVITALRAWPLWGWICGLALDPWWADAVNHEDATAYATITRSNAGWRVKSMRPWNADFDRPVDAGLVAIADSLAEWTVASSGTNAQRAAIHDAAIAVADRTQDPLTRPAVERLLSHFSGAWMITADARESSRWYAAAGVDDARAAYEAVAALLPGMPAAGETEPQVHCNAHGIVVCVAAHASYLIAGNDEAALTHVRERVSTAAALTDGEVLGVFGVPREILEHATLWARRLGWQDAVWDRLLSRIETVETRLYRTGEQVHCDGLIEFRAPAP